MDKRNSAGSSSSGSAGLLDTSEWKSSNNVYIKGLPAKCSNEDLQIWAEQVASPLSVKTIRDARDHGICTGLGKSYTPVLHLVSHFRSRVHADCQFLIFFLTSTSSLTSVSHTHTHTHSLSLSLTHTHACTGFVRFALPAQAKLFIALVNAVDGYEACFAKVGLEHPVTLFLKVTLLMHCILRHYTGNLCRQDGQSGGPAFCKSVPLPCKSSYYVL